MGLLEQISQMRAENISNEEITLRLQEQGASPRAINDAFNQEKIKNAVSSESSETLENYAPQVPAIQQRTFYQPKTQEADETSQDYYTPQDMTSPQEQYYQNQESQNYPQNPYQNQQSQNYSKNPPEAYQYPEYAQNYPAPAEQQMPEEYFPAEQVYEEGAGYGSDYGTGSSEAYTADTIIEIAEQVFSEKIKKFERQIEKFNEFTNLADTKIANNIERIKRMESVMDKLQIAILEKIGSYGKNIENIKKEMEMIEDSFSKMLPELHKKKTEHTHTEHKKTSKKTK